MSKIYRKKEYFRSSSIFILPPLCNQCHTFDIVLIYYIWFPKSLLIPLDIFLFVSIMFKRLHIIIKNSFYTTIRYSVFSQKISKCRSHFSFFNLLNKPLTIVHRLFILLSLTTGNDSFTPSYYLINTIVLCSIFSFLSYDRITSF